MNGDGRDAAAHRVRHAEGLAVRDGRGADGSPRRRAQQLNARRRSRGDARSRVCRRLIRRGEVLVGDGVLVGPARLAFELAYGAAARAGVEGLAALYAAELVDVLVAAA